MLCSIIITELLNEGSLKIEIDSKYPQAIGISMISDLIKAYGNSKWDILFNPFKNSELICNPSRV